MWLHRHFERGKERALLAYLVVEFNRQHRREVLGELLWPERPEGYARTNLRQALLGLRRAIGLDLFTVSDDFILFNNDDSVILDTREFNSLIDNSLAHAHRSLETCHTCSQNLLKATLLYRGDFLDDVFLMNGQNFQEWVIFYREQHFRYLILTVRALSNYFQHVGDFELAFKYAWQYVNLAPLEEAAHRHLMNLLTVNGRRSAALEQYQSCRQILARELGVEPSVETIDLYNKIKTGAILNLDPSILTLQLTNLPVMLTSFVGRENEVKRLEECLVDPNCRLITLAGMAGVGKTRLALHAASGNLKHFADGAWFIPLDGVRSTNALVEAIPQAIGLPFNPGDNPKQQLFRLLRQLKLLLILDHFDHLVHEKGFLIDLLQHAPGIKLLVTSQGRLNFQGACGFDLRGLEYPKDLQFSNAEKYSAVQLFVARAMQYHPELVAPSNIVEQSVQVCHLVNGLPLGIELSAVKLRKHTFDHLVRELQMGLDVMEADLPELSDQHKSLSTAFEASWSALSRLDQETFMRLSIFQEGFSISEAQSITGATLSDLTSLVDQSMVMIDLPGSYSLHNLLRIFGSKKLDEFPILKQKLHDRLRDHAQDVNPNLVLNSMPNREMFWDRLNHLMTRASRKQVIASVLIVDFAVNVRDIAVKNTAASLAEPEIARRLLQCLRKADTVSRFASQKFAIILEDLANPDDSHQVAEKILRVVGNSIQIGNQSFEIQINIGTSLFPRDGTGAITLFEHAENALLEAKKSGIPILLPE